MDAHDIDRGALPQTHGNGRRSSSTRPWGAANPPRPRLKGSAGRTWPGPRGGARSGQTRANPPQADPRPRQRWVACRGPRRLGDRGSPPCEQPPDQGSDLRSPGGGKGPRFGGCPPLCQASPAPSLGKATKFWGQCSLYCLPCPKIKKKPSGQHNFFSTTPNSIYLFSLKGITLAHLPLKSQHFVHVFDAVRAFPNSPKTHLRTLVL
jgi:hypothetical protein